MGLTLVGGIDDFLHEALEHDLRGKSILMLGYQEILLSVMDFACMAERMGLDVDRSVELVETSTGMIDAMSFFHALGFSDVHAMDVSDYQKADILFDLNLNQLPKDLHNRFDYVLDGGTLEHVFNFHQALFNVGMMLKENGNVFHYLPGGDDKSRILFNIPVCPE